MKVTEAIRLKKRGYSIQEIAKKAHVSPQAVNKALIKAKERGLWNGKSGIDVHDEHSYDEYFNHAKNSKMIGKPLTRKEWNDLWKGEPIKQPKREKREVLPDGTLKPKPFPKYRCLKKKCRIPLTPLDEVTFEQKDEIREQLISQGYTHICLKCLTVYQKPRTSALKEGRCHECGSGLFEVMKGEEFIGYYCKKCNLLYDKEEVEKGEIKEYEEVD